jgi:hypothetical protein
MDKLLYMFYRRSNADGQNFLQMQEVVHNLAQEGKLKTVFKRIVHVRLADAMNMYKLLLTPDIAIRPYNY